MYGTGEVVAVLRGERFDVSKSRVESLLATGRIPPPAMVGTSRVWTERDVENVRRALVALDGRPAITDGGNSA
jgi:hypothetical protein